MANKTYQGRIVQKHDTSANWAKATNFIPLKGEIIIYDDLNKIKKYVNSFFLLFIYQPTNKQRIQTTSA